MIVELNKTDLAALVRGTEPHYSLFEHPIIKQCGHFNGGFNCEWVWNYGFEDKLTENQLWDIYVMCRDSWEKKAT